MQAGFTKTVGLEMAQKGNITCNAICPGYVLTDLVKNQLEATSKARGIPKVNAHHIEEKHAWTFPCAMKALFFHTCNSLSIKKLVHFGVISIWEVLKVIYISPSRHSHSQEKKQPWLLIYNLSSLLGENALHAFWLDQMLAMA